MTFQDCVKHWTSRHRRLKDAAVGRQGENHQRQGKRIADILECWLDGDEDRFYRHGLDFGCGWGRLSGHLVSHCGHLWCADIVEDWVRRAETTAVNATGVLLTEQALPFDDDSFDLIVDIMTLQAIEQPLLDETFSELSRVACRGATVLSIGIAGSAALGDADERAEKLQLQPSWYSEETNYIDKAGDPYLIVCGAAR